jgi:hypothetical protein
MLEKQVVAGGGNRMSQGAMNQLYLNKNGLRKLQKHARSKCCENCRNTHEVSVPFLRPYFMRASAKNCKNTHEVNVPFLRPYFMRASAIFSQTIFRLV